MAYKDAVLLAISLLLAACMPLNPEENGIGRYDVTVTGGVDTTVAGPAVHYAGNQVEGFKYVIHLRTSTADPVLGIHLFTPHQPRVGTYQIIPRDGSELGQREAYAGLQLVNGSLYLADTGRIFVISAKPLRGSFVFEDTLRTRDRPGLRVSGSFEFD
jgi:hypothetical protein